MAVSAFIMCNHHLYLVPKHHYYPQNEPHILSSCYLFLSLQLLATTYLHSLPMDLPIMNISYKWNHTIRVLWFLASFVQYSVPKARPFSAFIWRFLSFCAYFFQFSLNHQQCPMFSHVLRTQITVTPSSLRCNGKSWFIFPGYSQLSHNKGIKEN